MSNKQIIIHQLHIEILLSVFPILNFLKYIKNYTIFYFKSNGKSFITLLNEFISYKYQCIFQSTLSFYKITHSNDFNQKIPKEAKTQLYMDINGAFKA